MCACPSHVCEEATEYGFASPLQSLHICKHNTPHLHRHRYNMSKRKLYIPAWQTRFLRETGRRNEIIQVHLDWCHIQLPSRHGTTAAASRACVRTRRETSCECMYRWSTKRERSRQIHRQTLDETQVLSVAATDSVHRYPHNTATDRTWKTQRHEPAGRPRAHEESRCFIFLSPDYARALRRRPWSANGFKCQLQTVATSNPNCCNTSFPHTSIQA